MIVDMMRNDLGRIARVGSVEVGDLFRVERYPTLWQMTSCVSAETGASLAEIFAALFPCASVTGAPKASTMRIIARSETAPRRVYTGSIGLVQPGRRATFNVAIRTVLIDRETRQAEYGVGGGVVWDSTPAGEYDECLLKARILTARRPEFSLLETLLWRAGEGYWLLDEHLQRLRASAEYFAIPLSLDAVQAELEVEAAKVSGTPSMEDTLAYKVRLLIDQHGDIRAESSVRAESDMREPVLACSSPPHPVDPSDVFLYHKTTLRQVYDVARAGCTEADDVLLYNLRGEATETARANIAVRIDGQLYTPPISCGLLAGTYRARLLGRRDASRAYHSVSRSAEDRGRLVHPQFRPRLAACDFDWPFRRLPLVQGKTGHFRPQKPPLQNCRELVILIVSSRRCVDGGSGRGAAWLARLHGVQKVASSNLVAPTL